MIRDPRYHLHISYRIWVAISKMCLVIPITHPKVKFCISQFVM